MTTPLVDFQHLLKCMAKNDPRTYLNGVCVEQHGSKTRFIATDGTEMEPRRNILPAATAKLLYGFSKTPGCKLNYEGRGIFTATNYAGEYIGAQAWTDQEFPDYLWVLGGIERRPSVAVNPRLMAALPGEAIEWEYPRADEEQELSPIRFRVRNGLFVVMPTRGDGHLGIGV